MASIPDFVRAAVGIYATAGVTASAAEALAAAASAVQAVEAPRPQAPPGRRITHDSFEWHATETFAEPLLAMWLWTGDIDIGTYRMLPGKL